MKTGDSVQIVAGQHAGKTAKLLAQAGPQHCAVAVTGWPFPRSVVRVVDVEPVKRRRVKTEPAPF